MRRDAVSTGVAALFQDRHIVQSLTAKLAWNHFQRLIYVDDIRDAVRHKFPVMDNRRENADGSRTSQD